MKKIISGKVREVYDLEDGRIVMVTTDRISAFDVILPSEIPSKGAALNQLSTFWFEYTKDIIPNHVITTDVSKMPETFAKDPVYYGKRTVMSKKLKMLPYEFIVRGYVFGSMWKAYSTGKDFCGQKIEGNYQMAERLSKPIMTPSSKVSDGHDEYISMDSLRKEMGVELADRIAEVSIRLYNACYDYAIKRGVIIADTKFEFGLDENGELTLADEIFTPDSSRFWDSEAYKVGESPKSFDKQFVRDWLIANHLDGVSPSKELPADIVTTTTALYEKCYKKITGKDL